MGALFYFNNFPEIGYFANALFGVLVQQYRYITCIDARRVRLLQGVFNFVSFVELQEAFSRIWYYVQSLKGGMRIEIEEGYKHI